MMLNDQYIDLAGCTNPQCLQYLVRDEVIKQTLKATVIHVSSKRRERNECVNVEM